MSKFPYVRSYEKLGAFFSALSEAGVPQKFTFRYFAGLGFPSSKDRDFVKTIKMLGFVDNSGRPTQEYQALKDVRLFAITIRKSVDTTYGELLSLDKNAWNVSENVLNGYFGRLTGASISEAVVYTGTFKALVNLSDHNEQAEKPQIVKEGEKKTLQNINLSINLPTTTDEKVYETLFKHLKELIIP